MKPRRNRSGKYAPTEIEKGEMPKPARFWSVSRQIAARHQELSDVENIAASLVGKDPRTIASYRKELENMKVALKQLEEIIARLSEMLDI